MASERWRGESNEMVERKEDGADKGGPVLGTTAKTTRIKTFSRSLKSPSQVVEHLNIKLLQLFKL